MRAVDIDAAIAPVNPISDEDAAADVPPTISDAMLRQITTTSRAPVWLRPFESAFDGLGRARARFGFVAALALIVLGVFGVNALSPQQTDEKTIADPAVAVTSEVQVPATSIESAETTLNTPTPDSAAPQGVAAANEQTDERAGTSAADDEDTPVRTTTADEAGDWPDQETSPASVIASGETETAAICSAQGRTLPVAIAAYTDSCEAPRADCDLIDGLWICSSEQIGDKPSGFGPAVYFDHCIAVPCLRSRRVQLGWHRQPRSGSVRDHCRFCTQRYLHDGDRRPLSWSPDRPDRDLS